MWSFGFSTPVQVDQEYTPLLLLGLCSSVGTLLTGCTCVVTESQDAMAIDCHAAMILCNAASETCQCNQGIAGKCGRCRDAQGFALIGGLL